MAFKKQYISFEETKQFSKLFLDYLNGDPKLKTFYSYAPQLDAFEQAINDRKKHPVNRKGLTHVLSKQYTSIKTDTKAVNNSINLLSDPNTFTVCTGHQLCLFTGPLYFIYKIISTINLAETLKKNYPSCNFVPVYWMATEDHDFEEISSINLFGRKVSWEVKSEGAVGRLKTDSIAPLIDELKQTFGDSEHARELICLFSEAYLQHNNLADATRYLVHELFGKYGLVVIDADDEGLKSQFAAILRDDILNHTNHKLVSATIAELNAAGYEAQVKPREINVFRLGENERIRIEHSDKETLLLDPVKYSPNVVLRPLYQQMIMPNIAYVGGPGEIAYWLEYKAMFDHHGIQMPVLMPRNFAVIMDEKSVQVIDKLNLKKEEIFKESDLLAREFVANNAGTDLSLKEQEEKLKEMFRALAEKVGAVDATLKANVEAESQKALASLKNIESKMIRSEKQKQETNINQIKRLRDKFLPEGMLQERHDNFSPYYLRSGKNFISDLKSAFDPFEFKMYILE